MEATGLLATLIRPVLNAAGWVSKKTYQWVRRPVLRIGFDPGETYDVRAIIELGGTPGRFCHFIVYNDGREVARNARVRLMTVSLLTEHGQPLPAPRFTAPRDLKWANELTLGPRDVEPDVPRRADLCYAVEGDRLVHFFAGPAGVGVQTVFPAGRYRVRVRVDADNARPVEAVFDVVLEGDWTTISVQPRSS